MQVFSPNLVPYCPSRSLSFIAGLGRTSTGSEFDGSVHLIHESCTTQIRKLVNLESRFRFWQENEHLDLHSLLLTAVHVFYIFSCFLWHLYNVLAILVIFLVCLLVFI